MKKSPLIGCLFARRKASLTFSNPQNGPSFINLWFFYVKHRYYDMQLLLSKKTKSPSLKLYKSFACCLSVWACIGIMQLICRLQNSPGMLLLGLQFFLHPSHHFAEEKILFAIQSYTLYPFWQLWKIAYYCNPILSSFYMTYSTLVHFFTSTSKLNHTFDFIYTAGIISFPQAWFTT